MPPLPIYPEQASTVAGEVDALYTFLVLLSIFFGVGIAVALVFFAVKYRRRHADERPELIHGSMALELAWSLGPLVIVMGIFVWGALLFYRIQRAPQDAMEIH